MTDRISRDAPNLSCFVVQTLGPTSLTALCKTCHKMITCLRNIKKVGRNWKELEIEFEMALTEREKWERMLEWVTTNVGDGRRLNWLSEKMRKKMKRGMRGKMKKKFEGRMKDIIVKALTDNEKPEGWCEIPSVPLQFQTQSRQTTNSTQNNYQGRRQRLYDHTHPATRLDLEYHSHRNLPVRDCVRYSNRTRAPDRNHILVYRLNLPSHTCHASPIATSSPLCFSFNP